MEYEYTTASIANTYNVTCSTITTLKATLGLKPKVIWKKGSRFNIYDQKDYDIIKKYFETATAEDKKRLIESVKAEKVTEEIDDHPLVKDKRMLCMDYWPDTTPKCFEDIEED